MSEAVAREDDDLSTLDAIRATFLARFQARGTGFHTLGEQVLRTHANSQAPLARPASAMTFRNFLQGRTTLRDPTGLLLYFEALGATSDEMRKIRGVLLQEVDRRLAAPGHDAALRAFRDTELNDMPYSRALAECEAATRFEQSIAAPIAAVSPTQYLIGNPTAAAEDGTRSWGMLQHVRAFKDFLEALELRLQDEFAAVSASDTKKRQWLAAAGVREIGTAYASYMLQYPDLPELLMSQRRYLLHGPMPERERLLAVEAVQRMVTSMYHPFERFAQEVVLGGDKKQLCRTPDGEIALEIVGNRLFGIGLMFYVITALGSTGTGAFFVASQRARREFAGEPLRGPGVWSEHHEALLQGHEAALHAATDMLEHNPRVPYGDLKAVFDKEQLDARAHLLAVWERDYAPSFAREAGVLMATELHHRGLLSDSALASFFKFFLTSSEGKRLQEARYPTRKFAV